MKVLTTTAVWHLSVAEQLAEMHRCEEGGKIVRHAEVPRDERCEMPTGRQDKLACNV